MAPFKGPSRASCVASRTKVKQGNHQVCHADVSGKRQELLLTPTLIMHLCSIFVFSSLTVEACLNGYYFESILKTFPGSTGVSSTSSKPHAPLTRVSQSSLNPLALKPATSTFKEIEATFILLSQEEYNEHRSEITHCR